MNCCRKIMHRFSSRNRAVICLTWIMPLRLVIIVSLLVHIIFMVRAEEEILSQPLAFIHVFIALILLYECRRSVRYHNTIKDWQALEKRRQQLDS